VNVIVSVEVLIALIVVAVLGLFLFGLRRRLIQRPGGTFDCSLRPAPPEDADPPPPCAGYRFSPGTHRTSPRSLFAVRARMNSRSDSRLR
jgi:hypothetical protein